MNIFNVIDLFTKYPKFKIKSLISAIILILLINPVQIFSIEINVIARNNPAPGYIFLGSYGDTSKITCLDNAMTRPYTRTFDQSFSRFLMDLKILPNNKIVGFCIPSNKWLFFDQDFNLTDSLDLSDPYDSDMHDIIQLPNGNLTVFGIRTIHVDMSAKVPGGRSNAVVRNFYIFEFDANKNIVFQWNAMEHYDILDATSDVVLTDAFINPFHCNSIFYDTDGNYIISSRFLDEITKINRSSGEIMWRLGGSGCRNNEFTFTNDTQNGFTGFSHQHDVRRLPNGNLLLFDNGNIKPNPHSRVVEYAIDENNKTVTKVWEYYHNPSVYSSLMGSVQRLPGGNTLIGWGGSEGGNHSNILTEVTPDGTVALEVVGDRGIYRAYKFPYKMDYVVRDIDQTGNYSFNNTDFTTNVNINIQYVRGNGKLTVEMHRYQPHNIEFVDDGGCIIFPYRWIVSTHNLDSISGTLKINTSLFSSINNYSKLKIYYRPEENTGTFNYLNTTYNPSTNQIEAAITKPGELMVVYNDYQAPNLTLPLNGSLGNLLNPNLRWDVSTPGEKYRLQISTDSLFQSVDLDSTNIPVNQANVNNLQNNTLYYWRIKAISQSCQSPWSAIRSFTTMVGTPDLFEPTNMIKDVAVAQKFKWGRVESATNYHIQISETDDFKNPAFDFVYGDVTDCFVPNLKHYTKYFWRVSAMQAGLPGLWSSMFEFKTAMDIVTLNSPPDESVGFKSKDTLRWYAVIGGSLYNIQISSDNEFHNIIIDESGINRNEIEIDGLDYLKEYFWRVKAFNEDAMSNWSETWSFRTTMPPPQLQLPSNGFQKQKISGVLIWESVPEAEEYQILMAKDTNFLSPILDAITDKNLHSFNSLTYATNYFWRVKAINEDCSSSWSEVSNFKTVNQDELIAPDLLFPAHQMTGRDLDLTIIWHKQDSADSYELQIDDDINFNDQLFYYQDLKDTTFNISDLQTNKKYFWRVRLNHGSLTSPWSDCWEFMTRLDDCTLIYPLDNANPVDINTRFEWSSVESALIYDFELSKDINFSSLVAEKENLTDTGTNDIQLENNTEYYWRVKAENFENTGFWSMPFKFITTNATNVIYENNIDELMIYPVPATDKISIRFNIPITEDGPVSIVTTTGIKIMQISELPAASAMTIDISELPNGIYFLIYESGTKKNIQKFYVIR